MATLLGSNPDFGALKVPDAPAPTLTPEKVDAAKEKFDSGADAARQKLSGVASTTRSNLGQMDKMMGEIPIPQVQQVPKPETKPTPPQEQWGSAAMMVAVIGSLFTRTPMTTALNAAAGVLNAYHKGDQEAADAAFKSWKVANDNALQLADQQQKTYATLMGALSKREGVEAQVGNLEERAAWADAQANAAAFKDPVMMQALLDRDVQAVTKLQNDRAKLLSNMQSSSEKLEKQHLASQAFYEWKQQNPNATPMEQLKKMSEIQGEGSASHQHYTEVQAKNDQKSEIRMTAIQNSIDHAIALTEAGGVSGLGGMFQKGVEVVGGATGMATGGSPAHQFENLVATIRAGSEAELSTPGSRSNPQFRQALANLAPMIGPGQSAETQANALKTLSNFINEMNGKPARYLDVKPIAGVPKKVGPAEGGGEGQPQAGGDPALTIRGGKGKPQVSEIGPDQIKGDKPPTSGPGSAIDNLVRVKTTAEYAKLPIGTWYTDGSGSPHQKRQFDDPKGEHNKIINQ